MYTLAQNLLGYIMLAVRLVVLVPKMAGSLQGIVSLSAPLL